MSYRIEHFTKDTPPAAQFALNVDAEGNPWNLEFRYFAAKGIAAVSQFGRPGDIGGVIYFLDPRMMRMLAHALNEHADRWERGDKPYRKPKAQ